MLCSGNVDTTIEVNVGETFSFKSKPKAKTRCRVTYTKGPECTELEFSCPKFNVKNPKSTCGRGERMNVVTDGKFNKKKLFCKKEAPEERFFSSLKVVWLGKRGSSSEVECSVSCVGTYETTTPGLTSIL